MPRALRVAWDDETKDPVWELDGPGISLANLPLSDELCAELTKAAASLRACSPRSASEGHAIAYIGVDD